MLGSIGAPELIVILLVFLLVIAAPAAIVIVLLTRKKVAAGLVPCGRCGTAISPLAAACPRCGEPRATRAPAPHG